MRLLRKTFSTQFVIFFADLFGGTGCEAEGSPASLAGDAQLTYPNIEKWTCWDSSTDILGQVRAGPVAA